jgi:hypothetical protein
MGGEKAHWLLLPLLVLSCSGADEREDPTPRARQRDRTTAILAEMEQAPARTPEREPATAPQTMDRTTLTRQAIQAGMRRAGQAVMACYDRYRVPGRYMVTLEITNDGTPRKVRPTPASTHTYLKFRSGAGKGAAAQPEIQHNQHPDTTRCICEAVSSHARFPRSTGLPVTISYPFDLR